MTHAQVRVCGELMTGGTGEAAEKHKQHWLLENFSYSKHESLFTDISSIFTGAKMP